MPTMITINLLDWRHARRDARRKLFLTVLGAAAATSAALVILTIFGFNQAIEAQNQRNRFLQQQIAEVDRQIKEIRELEEVRANLIRRMRIIEQLQQSRAQIVHYFDQVVATLPEGVYLTSLKQNGETTTINGIAESNGRVSEYMVNLDDSPWFDDPRLVVIKSKDQNRRRTAEFTLTFRTIVPRPDQETADTGGAEESSP